MLLLTGVYRYALKHVRALATLRGIRGKIRRQPLCAHLADFEFPKALEQGEFQLHAAIAGCGPAHEIRAWRQRALPGSERCLFVNGKSLYRLLREAREQLLRAIEDLAAAVYFLLIGVEPISHVPHHNRNMRVLIGVEAHAAPECQALARILTKRTPSEEEKGTEDDTQ